MGLFVCMEVGSLPKSSVTTCVLAFVRPFTSVDPHVNLHIELQAKSFIADIASVGLLSCVDNLVTLDFVFISKGGWTARITARKNPILMVVHVLLE